MKYSAEEIQYKKVRPPEQEEAVLVELTDATMLKRKAQVLAKMTENQLDVLAIYADLEHGDNFEYLTGFTPRFEEALLLLHQDGKAYCLLGNETLRMEAYSRLPFKAILASHFSLPNQPFTAEENFSKLLAQAEITEDKRVGLVGWKLFNSKIKNYQRLTDFPAFIAEAFVELVHERSRLINATALFIDPDQGIRTHNNANEVAHYAYGQVLASNGILACLTDLELGKKEIELANVLESEGQRNTVVTICSTGQRFKNANVYPSLQEVCLGDRFSMTVGYKGGLVSRAAYAVRKEEEIKGSKKNYLQEVAKPYFAAIVTWLSSIQIGMTGGQLYDLMEEVVPQGEYGWHLNPGHLVADEEWLSSPIFPDSTIPFKSGMMLQLDLILAVTGFSGANAENGIALADQNLRQDIQNNYPQIWQQIEKRRAYIQDEIGLKLAEEVLPLSNTVAYFTPLLLNKDHALTIG
ncbi:MAG TPA: M24 family metallopeptidase [Tetragenococcus sp.]|nr:M24 family metallopeptidase [Tetragenococcus sp.]